MFRVIKAHVNMQCATKPKTILSETMKVNKKF